MVLQYWGTVQINLQKRNLAGLPKSLCECRIIHLINQLTLFNLSGDFGPINMQSLLIYHLQDLFRLLKSGIGYIRLSYAAYLLCPVQLD